MQQTAAPLVLTDEDRAELARWSHGSSPMLAERARIVLACAEPGSGVARVAAELGSTRMTVRKWRRRFAEEGIEIPLPRHELRVQSSPAPSGDGTGVTFEVHRLDGASSTPPPPRVGPTVAAPPVVEECHRGVDE